MIGYKNKNRVGKPRLFFGRLKKLLQGKIGVFDTFVHHQFTFFKSGFVFFWNDVGFVRRNREYSREKGHFLCINGAFHELKKWFVPDAPKTIKLRIVVKLGAAVIGIKTQNITKTLEAHRTIGSAVKK